MRILFLHPNFPAQFRHLATVLGRDPNNQVIFGTKNENPEWRIQGVKKVLFKPSRDVNAGTHHYVRTLESAVLQGQAMYRVADGLRSSGFIPDVIYGHSGWGSTLFMKDVFPEATLLGYFEWFYKSRGADADFDPTDPLTPDDLARIRIKNTPILTDLYSCDRGLCPTHWQRAQFPAEFQTKLHVHHDGVDTDFFVPKPSRLVLPDLDLSHVDELVTYVGRGMEPYRGFPELIESIAYIQERRPNCHVVIVGSERVCYGKPLPDGQTYKQLMLDKIPLDLSRVHFVGSLPYARYLQVLQASQAHIYLTRPFVLSWSCIEAMATGCLVIGSATPPVEEVIRDGENGLLVDFFAPKQIADRVDEVFNHRDRHAQLRRNARQTVLDRYALSKMVPRHLQFIQDAANGNLPPIHLTPASTLLDDPSSAPAQPALV
ncbi:MAG: glycosyltransferase family 4 protein [Cyanophyceae cyanobacterium]